MHVKIANREDESPDFRWETRAFCYCRADLSWSQANRRLHHRNYFRVKRFLHPKNILYSVETTREVDKGDIWVGVKVIGIELRDN